MKKLLAVLLAASFSTVALADQTFTCPKEAYNKGRDYPFTFASIHGVIGGAKVRCWYEMRETSYLLGETKTFMFHIIPGYSWEPRGPDLKKNGACENTDPNHCPISFLFSSAHNDVSEAYASMKWTEEQW